MMIKSFKQFEAINIKDKIEKLKKTMEENRAKNNVAPIKSPPTYANISYKSSDDFDSIISDVKLNFSPTYINDYIIYHFDKYCSYKEMEECGYTDEVKYYKEFVDCDSIEEGILEEIWEYILGKYKIDFEEKGHEDLKFIIESYIQENFPFYNPNSNY